jgi:hypothetical protein
MQTEFQNIEINYESNQTSQEYSQKYKQYIPYIYNNVSTLFCKKCGQKSIQRDYNKLTHKWEIQCKKCQWRLEIKKPVIINLNEYLYRIQTQN